MKKCPICDLNYIDDEQEACFICKPNSSTTRNSINIANQIPLANLEKGADITHDELRTVFQCAFTGGMRRSLSTNSLVLIANHTGGINNPYDDKWIDGVLHYTGMGQSGDQDFYYMQNRTLYESKTNGVNIHLFEVYYPNSYTYRGLVQLAAAPYMGTQKDANGHSRKVCIFPLKEID